MAGKAEPGRKYLSHTLAEWACGLKFEHLSDKAVHTAKLFWYDSLGCALGGSQQVDARILLEH
jgi:2-methylcitrate dehydratase PrpD